MKQLILCWFQKNRCQRTGVTHRASQIHLDEQGIVVTISQNGNHMQEIPRFFTFVHNAVLVRLKRLLFRFPPFHAGIPVHKPHHQHFVCRIILNHCRSQSVQLAEINLFNA